ncbi:MAG: hypothetical protein R3F36_02845 [Candidatus Competibacteraceae bacterium]
MPYPGWRVSLGGRAWAGISLSGCLHSFFTEETALDVVAWHPDSDFGPRDDDHPMINRTVIPVG